MKAAVVKEKGKLVIEDVPVPEVNEYQCLIENYACATCNATDLKLIEGRIFWQPPLPLILGHESVGRVIEVGKKVRNFKKGDIVSRGCAVYPGEKLGGIYHSGLGGFAEYVLATDIYAMMEDGTPKEKIPSYAYQHKKIPQDIDIYESSLIINLSEIVSVVKKLDVDNKTIAVIGDGPVGLTFVKILKIYNNNKIVLIGHREDRMEIGKQFGADITLNSKTSNFEEEILKTTGKLDYFIDTVGKEEVIEKGLKIVKETGQYIFYASADDFDHNKIRDVKDKRLTIASPDETETFQEVIDMIQNGKLSLTQFYSGKMPLDQIVDAFQLIKGRKVPLKIIITLR